MIIPWKELEPETLENLISEFVSRHGTDNGDESTLESRISQVMQLLRCGQVMIVWDPALESTNIVPADEARAIHQDSE